VTNVPDESVGAKAGLKVHDVIVGVDSAKVGDSEKFAEWLSDQDHGKTVTLKIRRAGKTIELTVELQKPVFAKVRWTHTLDRDRSNPILMHADQYRLGVTLSETDETLRTQLRLAAGEGLVVTEVVDDSAAKAAGIQTHDVLTVLDGKRLTTVEAVNAQIQEIKDRSVELRLLRGGKEVTLHVSPRKTTEAAFREAAVRVWDTTSCKNCHQDAHALDPHRLMGQKLGVGRSVWTDGSHAKFHSYDKVYKAQLDFANRALQDQQDPTEAGSATKQVATLKTQLAEMQQTLAALEASLRQPESPAPATPAPEDPQKD
jgi:predicted metalloprotease with PDZ domain